MNPKNQGPASKEEIDKEFAELCDSYRSTIPQKSAEIQKTIEEIITAIGKKQAPSFKELERITHKLAGSSGSYGFQILSDLTKMLEENICDGKIQRLSGEDCVSFLRFWYALFSEQARLASQGKTSPTTAEKLTHLIESQLTAKLGKKQEAA